MKPQHLLRSLARVLPPLVLSLALPNAVLSQSADSDPPELVLEARARLAQAAQNSRLAPWQRDLMLQMARMGTTDALESSAVAARTTRPAHASDTPDGVWTEVAGASPGPRYWHSAIYDSLRDRMVVLGGYDGSGCLNDVWALSLAGTPTWTQLSPSGTSPPARYGHTAIYDAALESIVVFGGYDGSSCLNDVWALSLGSTPAWMQLSPTGTPPDARYGHGAIFDPRRKRMVVFGGCDESGFFDDVWVLSLASAPAWAQLAPVGTPPGVRAHHSAICDPVRDRMVVFGGGYYDGLWWYDLNDVWVLSLADTPAWAQVAPTGNAPGVRIGHRAIYDLIRDRMVVFGGRYDSDSDPDYNDVWALSLPGTPVWTQLAPAGHPPSARPFHSAIHDPVRDRMVVFGGGYYLGGPSEDPVYGALNDTWALVWGTPIGVDDPVAQPRVNGLRPPVPNPTRGTIAVNYTLAQAGRVQLGVYDASGRLVRQLVDGERRAGTETVVWNGTDASGARVESDVYFMGLTGPGVREMRKVILIR